MATNVDRIKVTLTLNTEFSAGAHDVTFEYVPADDDPLVAAARAKWRDIRAEQDRALMEQARAGILNTTLTT